LIDLSVPVVTLIFELAQTGGAVKPEVRLDWLKNEVDSLVSRYARECAKHKTRALTLKITSVLLATTITILLGLKFENDARKVLLSNIALVLGGLITVLSAYDAFFDPRSLWVRETVTFARIKDLQRDLRFWAAGLDNEEADAQALERFKRRLDRILDESLRYWMKIRGAPELEKAAEEAMPQVRQENAQH
jgi:hypothetical protein